LDEEFVDKAPNPEPDRYPWDGAWRERGAVGPMTRFSCACVEWADHCEGEFEPSLSAVWNVFAENEMVLCMNLRWKLLDVRTGMACNAPSVDG
jgi:hypothetical protein